jgi:hypothetical protein
VLRLRGLDYSDSKRRGLLEFAQLQAPRLERFLERLGFLRDQVLDDLGRAADRQFHSAIHDALPDDVDVLRTDGRRKQPYRRRPTDEVQVGLHRSIGSRPSRLRHVCSDQNDGFERRIGREGGEEPNRPGNPRRPVVEPAVLLVEEASQECQLVPVVAAGEDVSLDQFSNTPVDGRPRDGERADQVTLADRTVGDIVEDCLPLGEQAQEVGRSFRHGPA